MGSYIPYSLSGSVGGVQMLLAANYESRVQTLSKMSVPRAQFAGDTAVTLSDGSYNVRDAAANPAIPVSATAELANTTNIVGTATSSTGKPMVIMVRRDPFTGEIGVQEKMNPNAAFNAVSNPIVTKTYAVFNADGTYPGAPAVNRFDPLYDPWDYTPKDYTGGATANTTHGARYRVNDATAEIYVNNAKGMGELRNGDNTLINFNLAAYQNTTQEIINPADEGILEGNAANNYNKVVGMVEFEALQGGAMSAVQQQAAELSGVIQSLTSILRSCNESKRGILGIIK